MSQWVMGDPTIAELARTVLGAARVLHRHGIDCCRDGGVRFRSACARLGLAPEALLDEMGDAEPAREDPRHWAQAPLPRLIEHVRGRYHAVLRADLDRAVRLARRLEEVHGGRADFPADLAARLERLRSELRAHLGKEEGILFPMLLAGRGRHAAQPITAMSREHADHAELLAQIRSATHDYLAPDHACSTWRALYRELESLERSLADLSCLEDRILFPRALSGG